MRSRNCLVLHFSVVVSSASWDLFTLHIYVLVLVGDSRASYYRVTKLLPLPCSSVLVWDSSFSKTAPFLQLCKEAGLFSEIPFCCDLDVFFLSFRLELVMESLWWYKELGPWASMWFNFKSDTLGVTATPLQEKMARRAYLSLPGDEIIIKLPSSNWNQVSGLSGRGCQASELGERKMCCLSRPSMLFWLCCMTESPPWSTSWKLPLGHELGKQWALFSFYQGPKAGPAHCSASERSACISSAFYLFMTGRHNSSEFIVEINNFYKSRNKLFNSSFFSIFFKPLLLFSSSCL